MRPAHLLETVRRRARICCCALAVMAALLLFSAAPASAHGDLVGGSPRPGGTVDSAPGQVRLDFSEPPLAQSSMLVRDGCGRDVTRSVGVEGNTLFARTRSAEPGRWTIAYTIATDDGHAVKARTGFVVSGSRQCAPPASADEGQQAPPATSDTSAPDGQQQAASDDSSSPWPIALGAAAVLVIAGAVVVRLVMRRGPGTPAGRPGH